MPAHAIRPIKDRFDDLFIPEPNSGCYLWLGSVTKFGHGRFKLNHWKLEEAHRSSWRLNKGKIPEGICVLHRCDVPSCVNPDHLFLGTKADNNKDKTKKGRNVSPGVRGESNPMAKLKEADVLAIRSDPRPNVEIAFAYGVSDANISLIKQRKNWEWL